MKSIEQFPFSILQKFYLVERPSDSETFKKTSCAAKML